MRKENISIDQVFRNVRTEVLGLSNNNQRPIESSQLTGQAFYLFKSDYKNEFNYVESILENLNNAYFNETDYKPQLFKSLKKLNIILSEESSNERALLLSAKVYNELDQEDKALEITNSVIEVNTEYAAAYSFRSNLYNQLYWKTGEIKYRELEEKDENKLIELDPQDIYSYYTIISRNLRDNKYNKGIEIIEKALLSHPKDEELYRYKAIFHAYLWQNELALKYYDKAIELDPENGFYYMQKGDFLARDLERHQEAIELFQKANNLKPDEPSPYLSMILSYFTINKLDKIVELSEKLTAIDTDVPSSYYYLSNYYKRKEEYSKAITYLSLAIFKKIENNYVIQGLEYSGVHLSDLFLERSKLYDVLGIKIFECEDLNKGLEYVIKLESLSDEELKSPEIEFWDDKSQLMKMKLEIEELISKNCGL